MLSMDIIKRMNWGHIISAGLTACYFAAFTNATWKNAAGFMLGFMLGEVIILALRDIYTS